MSRESLAHAVNSSNLKQQDNYCTLDELHALGLSAIHSPIASEAFRFIDGLQVKSYNQLLYLLVKRSSIKVKMSRSIMTKIAEQVIKETAFKFCRTCSGRKEVNLADKRIICHKCNGSGLHPHSDMERAHAIGVSIEAYHKGLDHKFQHVQSIFTSEMKEALIYIRKYMAAY